MTLPEKIKIVREEGYHTHYIGKYRTRRQFMAFVVASLPDGKLPEDWPEQKRWYSIVHLFDKDGNHTETKHKYIGTTADGEKNVIKKGLIQLAKMLQEIGPIKYANIQVKLFEVEIDGRKFGLKDASVSDEGYESIHLIPNDLAFFPPWDGSYDT